MSLERAVVLDSPAIESDIQRMGLFGFGEAPRKKRPRMAERYSAHGVRCPLGEIVDLSETGMRTKCFGKPTVQLNQMATLNVSSGASGIKVTGRVVWVKRVSPITVLKNPEYQVGIQFANLSETAAKALVHLARYGYVGKKGEHAEVETANSVASQYAYSSVVAGPNGQDPIPETQARPAKVVMEVENLYAVLGVPFEATDEQLRHAFRSLALKYHPDRSSDPESHAKFDAVNKSYHILRDRDLRRRYDAMLKASVNAPQSNDQQRSQGGKAA